MLETFVSMGVPLPLTPSHVSIKLLALVPKFSFNHIYDVILIVSLGLFLGQQAHAQHGHDHDGQLLSVAHGVAPPRRGLHMGG